MSDAAISIRPMAAEDSVAVLAIYQEGIDTGQATFEQTAPTWDRWDTGHCADCRLVAEDADGIAGWAALSPVSARPVYAGVAEISIYVAERARGKRIGDQLMDATIETSEAAGYWTLQSSLFAENTASVRLHERHGFRLMGKRERIARMAFGPMQGVWRTTVILERRSDTVGIE